ncbi:MAG: class I SAM-dependent methyltransferase [Bacteriovoracaceae bacterium]
MIKEHYQHFHKTKPGWIHTEDYHQFWKQKISDLLKLAPKHKYLDLGCGLAEISKELKDEYQLTASFVDAFYSDDLVIKRDALDFLKEQSDNSFNSILLKQVIHHFNETQRTELLKELKRILTPNGQVLILSMPEKIEVPLPSKAIEFYEEDNFDFQKLYHNLKLIGLNFQTEDVRYQVKINKPDLFQTLRECYISTLSKLTEPEMEEGIKELNQKYSSEHLEFSDILRAIILQKD